MKNQERNALDLSRRDFLVGSVGTAVVMGFGAIGATASARAAVASKAFAPTIWFEIDREGAVVVHVAKSEMGQHIGTALARIVADELGADWNRVRIHHVATDPKWGFMVTGGSWSVFHSFEHLSRAGAAGRIALLEAGARLLGEDPKTCEIADGVVSRGGRSVAFGEIVQRGQLDRRFSAEELEQLPIKAPAERRLVGRDTRALDIPAKTNGTAVYGIDVEIDGMVYARPVVPPTRYGNRVQRVDDSASKKVKGYLGYEVLVDPSETCQGWVAVLADSYYAAIKATDAIDVTYEMSPATKVSEAMIQEHGKKLVADRSKGALWVEEGDIEATRESAATILKANYRTATALHVQLEPVNATVEFKDGDWHIHTGNQWQSLTLPTVAKALDVPQEKVIIHHYFLGGGFGRRLYGDYIVPAALTAKAVGKPVKMVFTRPDDALFDQPRSPSVQQFEAFFDQSGKLAGLEHALTSGWPTSAMAPGFMADAAAGDGKVDIFAASGSDHWYTLPSHRVRAIENDLAQKTFLSGWLRSVGPGWIGWGVESFIDEIAHRMGKDPLALRLELLDGQGKNAGKAPESVGGAKRFAKVLRQVAKQADWGRSLPENEGLGLAVSAGQERTMPTWVACAAHVAVNPDSGAVTVKKVHLAVDAGTVVHPDGALAQLEGSVLWGVSLALHESTELAEGRVAATNLHQYQPVRMRDVPELDIQLVPSDEFPVGLGEPGVIAVAPAIGNAIYDAVGVRLRDLPIRPEAVLAQLRSEAA